MSKQRERPLDRIAPDDFPEQVDADVETVDAAVEWLHKFGETTTPAEELPRCPECGTQRVYRKAGDSPATAPREHDTEYVCSNRHHFDESDPFRWVDSGDLAERPLARLLAELDDRQLTALAIYCYRPWEDAGPSYRTLATIWPYSSDWIGDRVREWKDGDHRDLVRDPRPRVSLAVAEEVADR
jgi:predicted RNA-binding Zn-ribbon protein involved in translation (DUF1610 family)